MKRLIFGLLLVLCLLFYLSDQMAFSDSIYLMHQIEIENLRKNLQIALQKVQELRLDLAYVSGNIEISSKISQNFKKRIADLQKLKNEAEKRLNDYMDYSENKIEKMTESGKKIEKELIKLRTDVQKLNSDLIAVRRLLQEKERNRILENIGCFAGGVIIAITAKALWDFFTGGNK